MTATLVPTKDGHGSRCGLSSGPCVKGAARLPSGPSHGARVSRGRPDGHRARYRDELAPRSPHRTTITCWSKKSLEVRWFMTPEQSAAAALQKWFTVAERVMDPVDADRLRVMRSLESMSRWS